MEEDNKTGFYFRCIACNTQLDEYQQTRGTCTECKDIIHQTNNNYYFDHSEYEIYRMWNPPMGDFDEFFQDVENEYNGGKFE